MRDLLNGKENSKVSVIVPVFNSEKYLKECIFSILDQNHDNIEVIAVDDGSTDKSLELLTAIQKEDSRLSVISQPNSGVSVARNTGLNAVSGDYLCFVDSDDVIEKDYIRNLLENIRDYDAVYSSFSFLYPGGNIIPKDSRLKPGEYVISDVLDKLIDDGTLSGILFGSCCMAIYKVDTVRLNNIGFRENLTKNEDGLFNIEYLLNSKKVLVLDNYGYYYRQWKQEKTVVEFSLDEYEKVNSVLDGYADRFRDYSRQRSRRNISEIFFESYKIRNSKENAFKVSKKLKAFCKENFKKEDYKCLDFALASKPKRLFMWLLSVKCYLVFSFLMRDVFPLLNSRIKH